MSAILAVITLIAAAAVMIRSIAIINRMTPATDHGIRLAQILLAAGGFGELASIFGGHQPAIAETLFVAGCGVLSVLDRRIQVRCPFLPDEGPLRRKEKNG